MGDLKVDPPCCLYDLTHTNFQEGDPSWRNLHNYHFGRATFEHFDSDFDGTRDSTTSCTACHNVHGAPNSAMIRNGELISPPGTTDYVPALNFTYLLPAAAVDTATYPAPTGTYDVYAWWFAHSSRADSVPYTINHSSGSVTWRKNQQVDGDQWNRIGDTSYTFGSGDSVVVSTDGIEGFGLVNADAIGFDSDFDGTPDIVVDNDDTGVIYSPRDWLLWPDSGYLDSDFRYIRAVDEVPLADLEDTIGGDMRYGGSFSQNHVCNDCHSSEVYGRTPNLNPKVLDRKADPASVTAGITAVLFTAHVVDPNVPPDIDTVKINLSDVGGLEEQLMYDDGDNTIDGSGIDSGDQVAGDGIYSHQTTIPDTVDTNDYVLVVTAEDFSSLTGTGDINLSVTNPDQIILDDSGAAFNPGSNCPGDPLVEWACLSGTGQEYGGLAWYKKKDDTGSGTVTWTVPEAGTYKVYAWWVEASGKWRSENVPYTINYSGSSETIYVNQTVGGPGGGQWNQLIGASATYTFNAGDTIVLSDNATDAPLPGGTTWVVGDAVKLERQ